MPEKRHAKAVDGYCDGECRLFGGFCRTKRQKKYICFDGFKETLGLSDIPNIIHAFDVSTIQGSFNVGASGVF